MAADPVKGCVLFSNTPKEFLLHPLGAQGLVHAAGIGKGRKQKKLTVGKGAIPLKRPPGEETSLGRGTGGSRA